MSSTGKIIAFKHTLYALTLLLLQALQSTPGLFVIGGVKPVLVIPAAIAIAMHEGEFAGGIYGAVAGLLCDASSSSLFGYNAFITAMFCIASGLMIIYLLRCNLPCCLLFSGVTLLVRGSIEFLFAYGMWGHDSVWKLYVFHTLPTVVYSLVAAIPVFWIVRALFRRFEAALHP